MCGLSGFQGVALTGQGRELLITALGAGIDSRGGHAIGYVSIDHDKNIIAHRRLGKWLSRGANKFIRRAATGTSVLMHARYSTCGHHGEVNNAHPFSIKRSGKTVLHGMHNGIIYNARESARDNGRDYTVDSRELFELLADGEHKAIEALEGYGVIVWVRPDDPERVYLCRLSENSDLVAYKIKGGGVIWGSTKHILAGGLAVSKLELDYEYKIEPHRVHSITDGGLYIHEEFKLSVRSGYRSSIDRSLTSGGWSSRHGWTDDFISLGSSSSSVGRRWLDDESFWHEELCYEYGIEPSTVDYLDYDELWKLIRRLELQPRDESDDVKSVENIAQNKAKMLLFLCDEYGIDPEKIDMSYDELAQELAYEGFEPKSFNLVASGDGE